MSKITKLFIMCFLMIHINLSQTNSKTELPNHANVMFGIGQLTLSGFNFEFDFTYDRFIFDFSHGINLQLTNKNLEDGRDKNQNLDIVIPWTSGFGFGYRFTEWINVRLEPKWHNFELYFQDDAQNSMTRIRKYTTFTLGIGVYTEWRPFENSQSALSGLVIAPNVRWWPNVSTSLKNDKFQYFNRLTNRTETHKARNIGMANSPFFFNVSIGYSFSY